MNLINPAGLTPLSRRLPIRHGGPFSARLTAGDASVAELAAPFAMSQPAISKHLKVLEHAGLITRSRDRQRRPCQLAAQPMAEAVAFLEGYRRFWERSYQSLDALLDDLQTLTSPNQTTTTDNSPDTSTDMGAP